MPSSHFLGCVTSFDSDVDASPPDVERDDYLSISSFLMQ